MTAVERRGFVGAVERFFRLSEHGTTFRTEVLGGTTTFATAGDPPVRFGGGRGRTQSALPTPIMGENAFIAFGLAAWGVGWQLRLGAVFVSGLVFLLITLLGVRSWLANSISSSMKHSFAVGIGLFLALVGLYQTGIVTSFVDGMPVPQTEFLARPDVPVKLGNLRDTKVLLAVFGSS